MSKTAKTNIVTPTGKEVWVACGTCNAETCHSVLANVSQSDSSPDGEIQVWNEYLTIQCQGCKTVSYCHEYSCSEDYDFNEETQQMENSTTQKLYPSRLLGRQELESLYDLPHGLYRIYKETHAAICNKLNILAGIGIRALVEAICNEKAAPGGNLAARIDGLVTLGLITADGAKILHSIRIMGNKAAHEAKANGEAELGIALDVVEHLLRAVYILPKRAAQL